MEEENDNFELTVSPEKRPLWMKIIACIFFAATLYFLYVVIKAIYEHGFSGDFLKGDVFRGLTYIIFCLFGGIVFSVTKTVRINMDDHILISRYCVGPFSHDIKSKLPDAKYVSIFLDPGENYEVNLWYVNKKHYTMYYFDEKEPAMKVGQEVAIKLKLNLLDATEKGNSKWIDLPNT